MDPSNTTGCCYNIPASRTSLARDSFGIGTLALAAMALLQPIKRHVHGPGAKTYTLTIYALSAAPPSLALRLASNCSTPWHH